MVIQPVRPSRYRAPTRRWLLARDTATLVAGALVALLGAQVLLPEGGLTALYSGASFASGVYVGAASELQATLPPLDTLGAVLPSRLHLDATPTPVPVITLPPVTPSPSPSVLAT